MNRRSTVLHLAFMALAQEVTTFLETHPNAKVINTQTTLNRDKRVTSKAFIEDGDQIVIFRQSTGDKFASDDMISHDEVLTLIRYSFDLRNQVERELHQWKE